MSAAEAAERIQSAPVIWQLFRLVLDDALVLAYLIALVCAYLIALEPYADRSKNTILREIGFWFCVVALAFPTALVDLLENAFLFAGEPEVTIADLTARKFMLFRAAAWTAIVLLVVGPIWRVLDSGDKEPKDDKSSTTS